MTIKYKEQGERKYIIIHSSFTTINEHIGVEELDRKHRANSKLSIGYHVVIRRDGIIEYGRPLNRAGAHMEGYDHESIGICLIGGASKTGVSQNNFTEAQFKNLKWILESLSLSYEQASVVGHSKLDALTKCPNFSVSTFLMKEGLAHLSNRK